MVILVAVWLDNRSELPDSRIEIYERFVEKIWRDQWDRRGLGKVFGEWAADAVQILAAIAGATLARINPPSFNDIELNLQKFIRVAFQATPVQARRASSYLEFFANHSGIMREERGRIVWAHKSFQEYLAAKAFANEVAIGSRSFHEIVELWTATHLTGLAFFFLAMSKDDPEFEPAIMAILAERNGPSFIADGMLMGVSLTEMLSAELPGRLRGLSIEEHKEKPRTLCEMLFIGECALTRFLQLRRNLVIRAELLDMLGDEGIDIDLRTDVMHSLRNELSADECQAIFRSVGPESWAQLQDWARLRESNNPFWEQVDSILNRLPASE